MCQGCSLPINTSFHIIYCLNINAIYYFFIYYPLLHCPLLPFVMNHLNGDKWIFLPFITLRQLINVAFSTNLKRIQTQHSLFRDFGADKTSQWSGGRV